MTSRETSTGRLVRFIPLAALAGLAAVALVTLVIRPGDPLRAEVIQAGLEHPWDVAFADDGRMVVTERIGRVRVYADGAPDAALLATTEIPHVRAELESGLMGVAVAGDTVFLCASRDPDGDTGAPWRVELLRASLQPDGTLAGLGTVAIGDAIGGPRHQGCAVEVDGTHLWLTVGDANLAGADNPAQDPGIPNGKVLRLAIDGAVPADNPFGADNAVYSIGHRNPQGLALAPDGRVMTVEHGTDENDEINVIVPGGNYGYPCWTGADAAGPWPEGCRSAGDFLAPAWASGAPTLATSGAAFLSGPEWGDWEGDLVVTTLKEEDLRRFDVTDAGVVTEVETFLDGRFGRLRAAVIGPDGALYLTTSNGSDDRIVRVTRSE